MSLRSGSTRQRIQSAKPMSNYSRGGLSNNQLTQGSLMELNGTKATIHDKRQTNVLNLDDLDRMKAMCRVNGLFDAKQEETEERKALQDKSKARVKNWPNTISALRQKKIDDKKQKIIDDEVAKRKIDEEEKIYQDAQK